MIKQILVVAITIFATAACANITRDRLLGENNDQVAPTSTRVNIQNIQINPGSVLPPYGLKVKADVAALKLSVTSDLDNTAGRLDDVQKAIEQIAGLAAEDEAIDLESSAINQVVNSSERDISSAYIWNTDSSSAILKLTTNLTGTNDSLLESLIIFNRFLGTISLPDTITVQALSLESAISNPEMYRPQLVAKVYQELEAVQEEYGQAVKFEITGLHGGLHIIPLSDTEYYIYIEPAIIVKEF